MASRLKVYGYINAKIRSRLSELLSDEDFSRILKAPSSEEAVQELGRTAYADEISVYASTGDIRAVEFALNVHEISVLSELIADIPGKAGNFTSMLLLRYEVETLKNALRLWFERTIRRKNIGGGSSYLYTEKIVHDIDYEAIVDAEGGEDIVKALEGIPYRDIVEAHIAEVESQYRLFPLEIALDRYYFSVLEEAAHTLPEKDKKIALRIIGVEVDLLNIDRIVRFVSFYRGEERAKWDLFLPGGNIPEDTLRDAYGRDEAEEALVTLLSDRYEGYRAFAEKHKSNPYTRLHMVENLLKRILYDEVQRLLRGYPFTIGTILAFLFLKRKEVRSVIRVLNAKRYGLSEERIREVL